MPIFTDEQMKAFRNVNNGSLPNINKVVGRGRNKTVVSIPNPMQNISEELDEFYNNTGTSLATAELIREEVKTSEDLKVKQSGWEQIGNSAMRLLPNLGLETVKMPVHLARETVEGLGYVFDKYVGGLNDDELANHDYHKHSDFVTDWIDKQKEAANQYWNVDRQSPNKALDFNDLAWYLNFIEGSFSSLPYMALGRGVGAVNNKIGNAVTNLARKAGITSTAAGSSYANVMKNIAKGYNKVFDSNVSTTQMSDRIGSLTKDVMSSIASRIVENGSNAKDVYDEVYDNILEGIKDYDDAQMQNLYARTPELKGKSKEEIASYLAGDASSNAFVNNFAGLAFLDLLQYSNINKIIANKGNKSKAVEANNKAILGRGGANVQNSFKNRLYKGIDKTVSALGAIEFSEGIEEGISYVGGEMAKDQAYAKAYEGHRVRGIGDYLSDAHAWESFASGMIGGMLMKGAGAGIGKIQEHRTKQQLRKQGFDEDFIRNYFSEKDDIRVREINDRERILTEFQNKMNFINGIDADGNETVKYNPYKPQLDEQGNIKTDDKGNIMYEILSDDDAESVRRQALADAATEMALNATRVGNYDLLTEFIKSINFQEIGNTFGGDLSANNSTNFGRTSETVRGLMLDQMQAVNDAYKRRVTQIQEHLDIESPYMADMYARELAQRDLQIEGFDTALSNHDTAVSRLVDDLRLDSATRQSLESRMRLTEAYTQLRELQALDAQLDAEIRKMRNSVYGQRGYASVRVEELQAMKRNVEQRFNEVLKSAGKHQGNGYIRVGTNLDTLFTDTEVDDINSLYANNTNIFNHIKNKAYINGNKAIATAVMPTTQEQFKRGYNLISARYNKEIDKSMMNTVDKVIAAIDKAYNNKNYNGDKKQLTRRQILTRLLDGSDEVHELLIGDDGDFDNHEAWGISEDIKRLEVGNDLTTKYTKALFDQLDALDFGQSRANAANATGNTNLSQQALGTQPGVQPSPTGGQSQTNTPPPASPAQPAGTAQAQQQQAQQPPQAPPVPIQPQGQQGASNPTIDQAIADWQKTMATKGIDYREVVNLVNSNFDMLAKDFFLRGKKVKELIDKYNNASPADKDNVLEKIIRYIKDDIKNGYDFLGADENELAYFDIVFKTKFKELLEKQANGSNKALADFSVAMYTVLDQNDEVFSIVDGTDILFNQVVENYILDYLGRTSDEEQRDKYNTVLAEAREAIANNNDPNNKRKRVKRVKIDGVDFLYALAKNKEIPYEDVVKVFNLLRKYQNNKANNPIEIVNLKELEKLYKVEPERFFEVLNNTHNKRKVLAVDNVRFNTKGTQADTNAVVEEGETIYISVTTGTLAGETVYNDNRFDKSLGEHQTVSENGTTNWERFNGKPISLSIKKQDGTEVGMLGSVQHSTDGRRRKIFSRNPSGFDWIITSENNRHSTNYDKFFKAMLNIADDDYNIPIGIDSNGNPITVELSEMEQDAIFTIFEISNPTERINAIKQFAKNYLSADKSNSLIYHLLRNGAKNSSNRNTEFKYHTDLSEEAIDDIVNNLDDGDVVRALVNLFNDIESVVTFKGQGQHGDAIDTFLDPRTSYAEWVHKIDYNFTQTRGLQTQALNSIKRKSPNSDKIKYDNGDHIMYGVKAKVDKLQSNNSPLKIEEVKITGTVHNQSLFITKGVGVGTNDGTSFDDSKYMLGSAYIKLPDGEILLTPKTQEGQMLSDELKGKIVEHIFEQINNYMTNGGSLEDVHKQINSIFNNSKDGSSISMFKGIFTSYKDGRLYFMYRDSSSNPVGEGVDSANPKNSSILLFSIGDDMINNQPVKNVFRVNEESKPNMTEDDIKNIFLKQTYTPDTLRSLVEQAVEHVQINITDAYQNVSSGSEYGNDNVKFNTNGSVTVFGDTYTTYVNFLSESGGVSFTKISENKTESATVGDLSYASLKYENSSTDGNAVTTTSQALMQQAIDSNPNGNGEFGVVDTKRLLLAEGLSIDKLNEMERLEKQSGISFFPTSVVAYNPNSPNYKPWKNAFGLYDSKSNNIFVNANNVQAHRGEMARTLFHENLHRLILEQFNNNPEGKAKFFAESVNLYNYLIAHIDEIQDKSLVAQVKKFNEVFNNIYAENHPNRAEEIVVEMLTNPNLRAAANSINYSNEDARIEEHKTLLDKFLDLILRMFDVNLNKRSILAKQIEVLQDVLYNRTDNKTDTNTPPGNNQPPVVLNDLFSGGTEESPKPPKKSKKGKKGKKDKQPKPEVEQPGLFDGLEDGEERPPVDGEATPSGSPQQEPADNGDAIGEGALDDQSFDDFFGGGDDNDFGLGDLPDADGIPFSVIPSNINKDEVILDNHEAFNGLLSFGVTAVSSMQSYTAGKTKSDRAVRADLLASGRLKYSCR